MKTSELQGAALDWAVAKCKGKGIEFEDSKDPWLTLDGIAYQPLHSYTPSTDWAQGGPIIERERIATWGDGDRYWEAECGWAWAKGPTPLVAAMRCYVTLKLGDEVEVPEELSA